MLFLRIIILRRRLYIYIYIFICFYLKFQKHIDQHFLENLRILFDRFFRQMMRRTTSSTIKWLELKRNNKKSVQTMIASAKNRFMTLNVVNVTAISIERKICFSTFLNFFFIVDAIFSFQVSCLERHKIKFLCVNKYK